MRPANHMTTPIADSQKENAAMGDQLEPTDSPAQADGDEVKIPEIMLWALSPAAECTLQNPAYADFARRFGTSRFAGEMECPAGGLTLEQLVLASMQIREGRAEQQSKGSAAPD